MEFLGSSVSLGIKDMTGFYFKIESPNRRSELISYLEDFCVPEGSAQKKISSENATDLWWSELYYTERFIFDDLCFGDSVAKKPLFQIGNLFHNVEELNAIHLFAKVFDELIETVGRTRSNSAYFNSPLWISLAAYAKHAVELLKGSDYLTRWEIRASLKNQLKQTIDSEPSQELLLSLKDTLVERMDILGPYAEAQTRFVLHNVTELDSCIMLAQVIEQVLSANDLDTHWKEVREFCSELYGDLENTDGFEEKTRQAEARWKQRETERGPVGTTEFWDALRKVLRQINHYERWSWFLNKEKLVNKLRGILTKDLDIIGPDSDYRWSKFNWGETLRPELITLAQNLDQPWEVIVRLAGEARKVMRG